MKIILLLIAILFSSFISYAQIWQWTHPEPNGMIQNPNTFPSDIESDLVHDIEKDSSGNIYVLGSCNDSLYLNNIFRAHGNGSYVAKYGAAGNLIWYQLIKPVTNNYPYPPIRATRMCVNAAGIFITGIFQGDGAATTVHQVSNLQFKPDTLYNGTELFLAKLNLSNGNVAWLKQSHPCNSWAKRIWRTPGSNRL